MAIRTIRLLICSTKRLKTNKAISDIEIYSKLKDSVTDSVNLTAKYTDKLTESENILKERNPELYKQLKKADSQYHGFLSEYEKHKEDVDFWSKRIKRMSREDLEKLFNNFGNTFADALNCIAKYVKDYASSKASPHEAICSMYMQKQYDGCKDLNNCLKKLKNDIHSAIYSIKVPDEGEYKSSYGTVQIERGDHYLVHSDSEFTQQKKDEAKWFKSISQTIQYINQYLPEVYGEMPVNEKGAVFNYTEDSTHYNALLQGYQGYWDKLVGLDKVHMSNNDIKAIGSLTEAIGRSKLHDGMWMQHGTYAPESVWQMLGYDVAHKKYPNINTEKGRDELAERFQQAIDSGEELYCPCFMSYGGAKDTGFEDAPLIMNSYFPAGTEALYASPISAYGGVNGGDSGKAYEYKGQDITKSGPFHASCIENEFIVQRGTVYKLKKFEFKCVGGQWKLYLDMDCIAQKPSKLPEAV